MSSYDQSDIAAGPTSRVIGALFAVMFTALTVFFVFSAFPTQGAEPAASHVVTPACAPSHPFAVIQLFA